jgi:replicative DNA helicase|tara:strand:+ start:1719 stop:3080 length:1362 start_codon:yes stop_codon:yes gene_type:complete
MTDTLTKFGSSFQSKIIMSLLSNKEFIQTISDIIEPSIFDSDANKWLVKSIKDYFIEYKTPPTLEVLKIKVGEIENDILKTSVIEKLKDAWNHREATDLNFVKKEVLTFCKNQSLKEAIVKSVDLLQNKEYDEIKVIIDKALKAGTTKDIGHDYLTNLEERLTKSTRDTIKTSWDIINEIMDGGLGKGELGVIVAPAGVGKTWCLQAIGASGVKQGLSVIHYTLELNQSYVGLRYDTVFSRIPTTNIKYYKEEVEKKIKKLKGNLIIKYFPTKSIGVQGIEAHLKQVEIQGIIPDLVIVDYADILRGVGTERRFVLENVYEDLRGLAGEVDIPIWTASQANRSSLEEDIIDATKVSESYAKVMIADFVVSLSRKVEDKIANTARLHIIKNRFGLDGVTYPATMNPTTGVLDVYDNQSVYGKETQSKMDNSEEYLRKQLANKYNDMNKNVDGFE